MRRITVFCLALPCVLLGLTSLAAAQNVTIQLTPQGLPIQIPAQGGSFNYTIAATNNGITPQQAAVWCMVTLPDSSTYGPVLEPTTITLNPGQTLDRLRTQNVPAGAPEGNYAFNAYIGVYPDSVWDSDTFPFEKLSGQPGGIELWTAVYNGPGSGLDSASSITVDSSGNVYVTGFSWEGAALHYDYATVKYGAAGNQIWVARYNGPDSEDDRADAIALDDSGNVFVTGESWASATICD